MPDENLRPDLTPKSDVARQGISEAFITQGAAIQGAAMANMMTSYVTGERPTGIEEGYAQAGKQMIEKLRNEWDEDLAKKFDAQYGEDMRRQSQELDAKYDATINLADMPPTMADEAQMAEEGAAPPIPEKGYQIPNPVTGEITNIPVNSQEGRQHWRRATEDYYRGKQQIVNEYMDAASLYPNSPRITAKAENMFNSMIQQVEMEKQVTQRAQAETQMVAAEAEMERANQADARRQRAEDQQTGVYTGLLEARGTDTSQMSPQEIDTKGATLLAEVEMAKAEGLAAKNEAQAAEAMAEVEVKAAEGAEYAATQGADLSTLDTDTPEGKKEALKWHGRMKAHEKAADREYTTAAREKTLGKPPGFMNPVEQQKRVELSPQTDARAGLMKTEYATEHNARVKQVTYFDLKDHPAMEGKDQEFFDTVWNFVVAGEEDYSMFGGDGPAAQTLGFEMSKARMNNPLPSDNLWRDKAVVEGLESIYSDPDTEFYKKHVEGKYASGKEAMHTYHPEYFARENLKDTAVNPDEADPRVQSMQIEEVVEMLEENVQKAVDDNYGPEEVQNALKVGTGIIKLESAGQLKHAIDVLEKKVDLLKAAREYQVGVVSTEILTSRDPREHQLISSQHKKQLTTMIDPLIQRCLTHIEKLSKQLDKKKASDAKLKQYGRTEGGGKKLLRQAKQVDWGEAVSNLLGAPMTKEQANPEGRKPTPGWGKLGE